MTDLKIKKFIAGIGGFLILMAWLILILRDLFSASSYQLIAFVSLLLASIGLLLMISGLYIQD